MTTPSTEVDLRARREDPVYQAALLKKWRAEAVIEDRRTLENAKAHDDESRIYRGNVAAVQFFQRLREQSK